MQTLKSPYSLEELPTSYRDALSYGGRVNLGEKFIKTEFAFSDRDDNQGLIWPGEEAFDKEVRRVTDERGTIYRYVSLPNQQHTPNKLPTELWGRNFC